MTREYNKMFHESHSWKKQVVYGFTLITPQLANDFLTLNTHNRPIRNALVDQYVDEMKNGKWKKSGDNIRISKTGVMLDAQHTLLAVVKSGISVTRNVVCGLDDEVFDVIDSGRSRSAGDAVSVAGHKNHTTKAGAAKILMGYQDGVLGLLDGSAHGSKKRYTNADVVEYVNNKVNTDLFEDACSIGNKCASRAPLYSPSTYSAFTYLFSKIDRDKAMEFMHLLTTGENMSKSHFSMVYLLRKKLIDLQLKSLSINIRDKYALLIKAWNAFMIGKEVGQLAWNPKEKFPKILKTARNISTHKATKAA